MGISEAIERRATVTIPLRVAVTDALPSVCVLSGEPTVARVKCTFADRLHSGGGPEAYPGLLDPHPLGGQPSRSLPAATHLTGRPSVRLSIPRA